MLDREANYFLPNSYKFLYIKLIVKYLLNFSSALNYLNFIIPKTVLRFWINSVESRDFDLIGISVTAEIIKKLANFVFGYFVFQHSFSHYIIVLPNEKTFGNKCKTNETGLKTQFSLY